MWLCFKDSKIDIRSKQKTNGTLCIVCACVSFFFFNKLMLKQWRCHCVCMKGMGFSNVFLPLCSPIARKLYNFACFFFPRMSKWLQLEKTALGKQTLFTVMRSETSLFTQLSADLSAGSESIVTCHASQQVLCFQMRLSSALLTAQAATCFLCFPFAFPLHKFKTSCSSVSTGALGPSGSLTHPGMRVVVAWRAPGQVLQPLCSIAQHAVGKSPLVRKHYSCCCYSLVTEDDVIFLVSFICTYKGYASIQNPILRLKMFSIVSDFLS